MAPPDDSRDSEEEKVLSPDELDIAEDSRVVELEEGRFVVSSDQGRPSVPQQDPEPDPDPEPKPDPVPDPSDHDSRSQPQNQQSSTTGGQELNEELVRRWLRSHVSDMDSQYGFHVTAKFDDSTRQQQLVSNDVVTVFENLLMWYGQQLDSQTAVEQVLGILLTEANLSVQYPQRALKTYLAQNDLGPEDSIADLLDATEDGFAFPPAGSRR